MFVDIIKETYEENKKNVKIIFIILIIGILCFILVKTKNSKNYIITYKNENYCGFDSTVPLINISDSKQANEEITKLYANSKVENKYMTYDYYKNKEIISLIINIYNCESNDMIDKKVFYNIDTSNEKIISNDELIERFNITKSEIENIVLEEVKKYYNYEIEKEYIKNISIEEYLNKLEDGILTNAQYFVKDNKLYVYRSFDIGYELAYDAERPFKLFEFKIN